MQRDLFTTGLLILIAVSLGVGVWSLVSEKTELLKPGEKDLFSERVSRMVNFEIEGDTVSYTYTTDKLPEKLDPREVMSMRTESSYTRYMGDLSDPNAPEYKLELRAFSKPAYANLADGWYYIEYGRTTKENFDAVMKAERPLSWLFGEVAYAADTFYSAAGDGFLYVQAKATWADARGATTADGVDYTTYYAEVGFSNFYLKADSYTLYRAFYPFDTSSISSSASIASASFNVYATTTNPTDTLGSTIHLVRGSQATHTSLVVADFDNIGTTQGSGDTPSYTTLTYPGYNAFNLNATGLTWIAKNGVASNCSASTGISCFALRDYYDLNNITPCTGSNCSALVYFAASEAGATENDPYLTVNYTQTFAPWQFWEF